MMNKETYERVEGFKDTNVSNFPSSDELKNKYDMYQEFFGILNSILSTGLVKEETMGIFRETYKQLSVSEEGGNMDWQEKYLDKLDQSITEIKQNLRDTESRIVQIINQTLSEIRDRDNQRHQEFLHTNQKVDYFANSVDKKIDEIRNEIKEDRKWIIGIAVTTILGIAAMVITVLLK